MNAMLVLGLVLRSDEEIGYGLMQWALPLMEDTVQRRRCEDGGRSEA